MTVPLYGFLDGDTLGVVILVQPDDTMERVCENLQQAACMRVTPRQGLAVWFNGRALAPSETVKGAGLARLDRIDVAKVAP